MNYLLSAWDYIVDLYNNDHLVFLTMVIILFYTIFTYKLWRESVSQTDLQLLSIPAIYIREKDGKERLRIRNLGSNAIIGIKLEKWNLIIHKKKGEIEKWMLEFKISYPNILKPDEERDLILTSYLNNEKTAFDLSPHINPKYSKFIIPLKVIFRDIRGKVYRAKFSMGRGELSMIKLPRKMPSWLLVAEILKDNTFNWIMFNLFKLENRFFPHWLENKLKKQLEKVK